MIKIPTVEYCCCGLSIRLGTLLIGLFAIVGSIGAFINTLESYYEVQEVIGHPDLDDPRAVKIREHVSAIHAYLYLCYLVSITSVILATMLLIGYCTSNRTLLRAWIIGTLILQMFSFCFNMFISNIFDDYLYLLYNVCVFINLYFACVVNSYAQEIIKGSSSGLA